MRKNKSIIVLLLSTIVAISACNRKDDSTQTQTPTPPADGKVKMEFFNKVNGSALNLNNQWYQNANGDSFTVSKFNYYISNVFLHGVGATPDYIEPESYHLIQQIVPTSNSFDMLNVPAGNYISVTFMIGVDSVHNISGAQTGALDPLNGMFWDWNTGYIMLKFEGNSPQAPGANGNLTFHAGGFSGANNVLRTVTLSFPQEITVTSTSTPHIHLDADVLKLFQGSTTISFANTYDITMPGKMAKSFADNYANMFTISYAGI